MAFFDNNVFNFIGGAASSLLGGFSASSKAKAAGKAAMKAAEYNADVIRANRNKRLRDIQTEFSSVSSTQRATAATSGVSTQSASFNTVFQATASDFVQALTDERNAAQNEINAELYRGQLAKAQADAQAGSAMASAIGGVISGAAELFTVQTSDASVSSPGGNVYSGYSFDPSLDVPDDPYIGFSSNSALPSSFEFAFNEQTAPTENISILGDSIARRSGENQLDQLDRIASQELVESNDFTVASAIREASSVSGVDVDSLTRIARVESGLNPNAHAKTSSASGLFQFIDSTWEQVVKKYGGQFGISVGDRFNPRANAIMGALFFRDNAKTLETALGRAPTLREVYLAHFAGVGGAINALRTLAKNPYAPVSAGFSPAQIKANRGLLKGSLDSSIKRLTDKLYRGTK